MGVLFLLFFVLVAHASSSANSTQTPPTSRLLILFLDGLRWDYFNHFDDSSGFGQMRTRGCHVPRVKPVFPSTCYANVHALFAGHNLTRLDNTFNDTFEAKYTHPDLIWNRVAEEGRNVKLFHFPFCSDLIQAGIDCVIPMVGEPPSLQSTLENALFDLTNGSTDLAVIFYGELDRIAHEYGPSSEELMHGDAILSINEAISNVIQAIQSREDADLNFAVVADHGMTDFKDFLAPERVFKWNDIEGVVNLGTAVGLWPRSGAEEVLVDSLSSTEHLHVFTPRTVPMTSWQPSALPPLMLVAESGYIFKMDHHPPASWDHFQLAPLEKASARPRGVHGYLPDVGDMHTTFLGYGPAFAPGCDLGGSGGEDAVNIYDLFPLLIGAMKAPVGEAVASVDIWRTAWEKELIVGLLFMVLATVLILGIVLRRMLSIRRKGPDNPLIEDEYEEEEEKKKEEMV